MPTSANTAASADSLTLANAYDADAVARARDLVPLLRGNAASTEAERRVHPDNLPALEEAGLLNLTTPRAFGGQEANLRTFTEVTAELGRGCGSTAWVAALTNGVGWMAGLFPDACQKEYWGTNPSTKFCGVFSNAPGVVSRKTQEGWSITGAWSFASGCLHADWALISFPRTDEAGEVTDLSIGMAPMSEFRIEDTWFVAGMQGTGSQTIHAKDLHIPEYRVISLTAAVDGVNGNEHPERPLFRSAFVPYLTLLLAAPQLGMARGALDIIDEQLAKNRPISYALYPTSRQSPSTQFNRAEAQRCVDTAHLLIVRAVTEVDQAAAAGTYPEYAERARMKADSGNALRSLRQSMQFLLDIGGASSFAAASPLQRQWRDLEVASRHAVLSPDIAREVYGRVLTQVDEPVTPLV
jgi:alkylation response protein AidB-like acyl-CoA dehydrogenase